MTPTQRKQREQVKKALKAYRQDARDLRAVARNLQRQRLSLTRKLERFSARSYDKVITDTMDAHANESLAIIDTISDLIY